MTKPIRDKSQARLTTPTLKAAALRRLPPGLLHDGKGLYLSVHQGGTASWLLRFMRNSKAEQMGLGSLADLTAPMAREEARRWRAVLAQGLDPKIERAKAEHAAAREELQTRARETSFRIVAEQVLTELKSQSFSDATKRSWQTMLEQHAYPVIGDLSLAEIDNSKLLDVLKPIWGKKRSTARNVRQRIERIFAIAKTRNLCTHNPAHYSDLKEALALYPRASTPKKHAAMPWQEAPAFYRRLKAHDGYAARVLMLVMLTAVRSGEAVGARFEEFDLKQGVWTIPAERMKGKPGARFLHRVPITPPVKELVEEMNLIRRGPFLFPHRHRGATACMSESIMRRLLDQLGTNGKATTHGFRSTFRDWARDLGLNREAAEAALAHRVGGVEGAYARSDMLEFRRGLMAQWNSFLTSPTPEAASLSPPPAKPPRRHLRLVDAA